MVTELEEDGAAAGDVNEGAAGGGLEPCGASSDGECEAALDAVEVRSFRKGELELMSNGAPVAGSYRAEVLDFLQASCSLKRFSAGRWELELRAV